MVAEEKKDSPPPRKRMTCLMWVAILVLIVLIAFLARICAFVITKS